MLNNKLLEFEWWMIFRFQVFEVDWEIKGEVEEIQDDEVDQVD